MTWDDFREAVQQGLGSKPASCDTDDAARPTWVRVRLRLCEDVRVTFEGSGYAEVIEALGVLQAGMEQRRKTP